MTWCLSFYLALLNKLQRKPRGIGPLLSQKWFHTSLLFIAVSCMLLPCCLSLCFGFLPPSPLCWCGSWRHAKLNKGLAVQAFWTARPLGWSGFFSLAFRSGLHWAGWHQRKAPFRVLCFHMPVIHGCITMGTVQEWAPNPARDYQNQ